jgi:hypothetical protein
MAIWISGNSTEVRDQNRENWTGIITPYGADTMGDLQQLPVCDGTNQGSSCFVLENGTLHILGTDPNMGINGWRQI